MWKILVALAAQSALVTAAFAQGGSTDAASLAEATQKALVQEYCQRDGRFMSCLGVDITKNAAKCAELVRGNWAFCRSNFMMTAPASIPLSDARSYGDNLAECLRSGAIAAAGKSAGEVGQCVAAPR